MRSSHDKLLGLSSREREILAQMGFFITEVCKSDIFMRHILNTDISDDYSVQIKN